jgi:outer membrane protein assembly factor BamD (BamD/ComL family)
VNQHAKLKAATVAKEPWPITIGQAAYALWMADVYLSSMPRHPEVAYLLQMRQEAFEDAIRDMRRALENV